MIGGSNKNVSMNRRAALLGNTASAEPKQEEKKVSPEMSQEERKRLAI
jgi:hypothetical protein